MKRIGVDVGGTFTDLIYVDDEAGTIRVHKLPTTPDDPSQGTIQGVKELAEEAGADPSTLDQVFHGTTIATNIVIEHTGAKVGMLTTEGYRDILHIARHKKPLNFSNYQDLPWQAFPVVRRRYRLTVPERITGDGSILVPLDEERAREQVRALKEAGVEAVCVCFLFSFLNPEHERRVAEIVREEFPEAFLSVSSEVIPQYREYERFSTVGLNAYVGPKVASYVANLGKELEALGVRSGLHLMTSASGVATSEAAIERPVNLLMSGPVAGVVGGIWAGKQAGYDNVITLDVGGTSADIGLAQEGRLRMKHLLDTKVGPYQAMIPMADVDTIGAGGGSIAYVDAGGIFRVGPRSAGAVPGPAAYGRGGTEATATDAMVNLGWLLPEAFLGGGMSLDREKARAAFADGPAEALGMSVEEASMGAVQILSHSMVQSIEENSVRKGFDPRDFALVAEGGAGPLFAVPIAIEVGTPHVVVPPYPGICAAMGLVATDMVYEYAATTYQKLSTLDAASLQSRFEELEAQASEQLAADGIETDRVVVQRIVEARYLGQGYELRVDVGSGTIDDAWVEKLRADFHDIHEREYSRRFEDSDIEVPNIRVRGIGLMPELVTPEVEAGGESADDALRHEADAWFLVEGSLEQVPTRYYDREALRAGNRLSGPAIVNQYDSTTVIPPGIDAHVDRFGNIVIEVGASAQARAIASVSATHRVRHDEPGGVSVSSVEYELGKHPGPPELERVDVDPITMRVLGGAFHAIAKEMSGVLFRMSYSSIIRESEDLGAGIFDAQGRELCESDSTPMHIGSLPWYIRGFMRHLEGKLVEGDVIIHNHPYFGASHSPDIAVAVPIFWEDELMGFAAVTAHVLDVGGSFPGINADAFDVYAEAKIYDGLRWYQAGELNEDLDKMIFDNVRTETMNRGDMNAMMAACQLGRDRMLRLYQRYGVDTVMSAAYDWMDYSERMLREQIRALPGRRVQGADGLARRRRAEPRRAASRRDEGDRRGRRDHDRPDGLERGGADRLQRPVRGVAPRRAPTTPSARSCSTR